MPRPEVHLPAAASRRTDRAAGTGAVSELPVSEIVEFGGLTIAFDRRLLRPRPWTTLQSRWAAELLPSVPEGPVLEGAGRASPPPARRPLVP